MLTRLKRLISLVFGSRDEWKLNRFPLLWSVLSGVAGLFVFPGFSAYILAWFFLVPFFYALGRVTSWRMAIWCTFAFGYPFYYGTLWWLNTLTVFNPFIPLGIAFMPVLGMFWLLIFSLPAAWIMRKFPPGLRPFFVALTWVGFEQTHLIGDLAFPWNFLGHALAVPQMLSIAQWAAVGGVGLLSFFVALTNAAMSNMLLVLRHPETFSPATQTKRAFHGAVWSILSVFALLCASMLIGSTRLQTARLNTKKTLLRVAILQPAMRQLDKVAYYENPTRTNEDRLMAPVREQLEEAGRQQNVRLCIMPESVMPSYFFVYQDELHHELANASTRLNMDFLFGADNREVLNTYAPRFNRGQRFGKNANTDGATSRPLPRLHQVGEDRLEPAPQMAAFVSAWQVKPNRGFTPIVYDKMQLVPFGECAPLLGNIPGFNEFIMMAGSYQRGTDQVIFETDGVKYGPVICFESSFPHLTRGIAKAGAHFITVMTNDGWYSPSHLGKVFETNPFLKRVSGAGPQQHLAQSVMRAIETELPVLRAANNGISAIISPYGQILSSLPTDARDVLITDIDVDATRYSQKDTFYVRFGDWPGIGGLCLIIIIFALMFVSYKKTKKIRITQNAE